MKPHTRIKSQSSETARPTLGTFRRILVGGILLLVCGAAAAHAAGVTARKTLSPITADGNLNESVWTTATFTSGTRVIQGTSGNTVQFATLWDNNYLYVAVKVTDSNLYNDTPNSGTPLNVWQDDSVEVYLDANHNKGTIFDSFDRQYVQGYNDTALGGIGTQTGVLHGWAAMAGGYSVEMAIPWTNLGITPTADVTVIGFDVGCNDDDNGGTTREGQLMWNGTVANSHDTSAYGDLTLSSQLAGNAIAASKTLSTIMVDGNLNETVWTLSNTAARVVQGASTNTETFGVLWDSNYLYVGVKVLDTNLYNDTTNSGTPPINQWQDDSVEVFIDANHNKGTTYDASDRQFVKGYNDSVLGGIGNQTGVLHAWAPITGGYTVEMAIPWSNLGITPTAGVTVIGFDVGGNDDDNGGTSREGHLVWAGQNTNSTDTSQFGDLLLSSATVGTSLWSNPMPPPTDASGAPKCWFGVHDSGFGNGGSNDSKVLLGASNVTLRNFSTDYISQSWNTNWWGSQADSNNMEIMVTVSPKSENTSGNLFNLTLSKLADPTVAGYSTWDQHLRDRATQIKNWKKADGVTQRKVMIRLMHEMNGAWFFWGQDGDWKQGRDPNYAVGNYIKAWKHVISVFQSVGATNASFVWCPSVGAANADGGGSTAFGTYFPGTQYVHWIAADGYNPGAPSQPWRLLAQVFDPWLIWVIDNNYTALPAMISETGCDEPLASSSDGSNTKAAWVNNAIWALKPGGNANFQTVKIRAFIHQQYNDSSLGNWLCNSTPAALTAYQSMVQSSFFKH